MTLSDAPQSSTGNEQVRQGRDMTGWFGCITNDSHCFAKPGVGSQPAGIIFRGGLERGAIAAVLTDQFSPPHASFVP